MAENKTESKSAARKPKIQVGCQGWNYADWTTKAAGERIFYPRGTKSGEMLEIYARAFETIEVDSTFYAIPAASAVENWFKKTPEDFTFALKMPREITHDRGLSEKSFPALEEFCERISLLEKKLAAVLIQMPPQFDGTKENGRNLRNFLARLPKEIRFAVEFRNREWLIDWTFEELEKNSVALCLVEGGWIPREMMFEAIGKLKTDFAYIRFMGERDLTTFDRIVRPQDAALQIWKEEIGKIKAEDIYIYFSNFYEGFAPESVNRFREMFGQKTIEIEELENQGSLF
ncbi:MAG: DUF72 domain-containing protein [Acidobacteriota bacterium]|nr:DUF72 domain-containing protein [Acidobacteriota bacterium]